MFEITQSYTKTCINPTVLLHNRIFDTTVISTLSLLPSNQSPNPGKIIYLNVQIIRYPNHTTDTKFLRITTFSSIISFKIIFTNTNEY